MQMHACKYMHAHTHTYIHTRMKEKKGKPEMQLSGPCERNMWFWEVNRSLALQSEGSVFVATRRDRRCSPLFLGRTCRKWQEKQHPVAKMNLRPRSFAMKKQKSRSLG